MLTNVIVECYHDIFCYISDMYCKTHWVLCELIIFVRVVCDCAEFDWQLAVTWHHLSLVWALSKRNVRISAISTAHVELPLFFSFFFFQHSCKSWKVRQADFCLLVILKQAYLRLPIQHLALPLDDLQYFFFCCCSVSLWGLQRLYIKLKLCPYWL